ncbi:transposase [Desulfosediminicola flagellatus]|uniref:transposase n=1 Tax=Desulfosediminicola flagellatus TaxID=2569541 RepID=UPI0010ACD41E|nr:transposase [Desulfosediminicola flagellatus]
MSGLQQQKFKTLFTHEHACIAYLFAKRWPAGFICPFCGQLQREIAPAYTVVCRYCRKHTSITAHTLMHGSKKNLVSWMRVVWQFCSRDEGISAREIQHLMALTSYQTAWRWLQKIRRAAAIADKRTCHGLVLFCIADVAVTDQQENSFAKIGLALEFNALVRTVGRIRFVVLDSNLALSAWDAFNLIIDKDATVMVADGLFPNDENGAKSYDCIEPTVWQLEQGRKIFRHTSLWLSRLYRGAVERRYLQDYLAEFSFRYNTASWSDRAMVMDHLLTGLVTPLRSLSEEELVWIK